MAKNNNSLKDKVAIVGVGTSEVSYGIVSKLLQQGATVIVPAQSSHHLELLHRYLVDCNTDKLVTLITDLPDYDKAVQLTEAVYEEYGPLNLVVFPFEYQSPEDNLSDISIAGWQRAVEENLAAYFIACRAGINAMKIAGEGMFVAIVDTDCLARRTRNSMTDMLISGQMRMARSFFEEVKNTGVRFHHLFISKVSESSNGEENMHEALTVDKIGEHILSLYQDDKGARRSPFLFLRDKDLSDLHHFFNNN